MYIQDDNDSKKQSPPIRREGFHNYRNGKATAPGPMTASALPSYVVINNTGSYSFAYGTDVSVGTVIGNSPAKYEQAVITNNNSIPLRLDISPSAWSGSDAAGNFVDAKGSFLAGNVTFVYTNKK